ncbi:MAG: hypothetical protein U9P10_12920 [Thermodesulfobacteriota bacterium]|nr:hypothetical protein [Thermodesulfobacteriota bacterium]
MTKNSAQKPTPRINRTIVLPFDQEKYWDSIKVPKKFRQELDALISTFPELFQNSIKNGYLLKLDHQVF